MSISPIPDFSSFILPQGGGGASGGLPGGSSGSQPNFSMGLGMGQNQYMSYPSMSYGQGSLPMTYNNVGVPQSSQGFSQAQAGVAGLPNSAFQTMNPDGTFNQNTYDPSLSASYAQWLQQMLGKGATPFNLSTSLPSGGQTQPGQLSATENPFMQAIQQMFMSGNLPLSGQFNQAYNAATTGGTSLPVWQADVNAMQGSINDQYANIKEQFGASGALGSSEMASAMERFGADTASSQNALLGNLSMQEQQTWGGIAQGLGQLSMQDMSQMTQFGQGLQNMDQAAVDKMYQEFIRTSPEYGPLLPLISQLATTFPGTTGPKQPGILSQLLGDAGGIAGGIGGLFTGIGNL